MHINHMKKGIKKDLTGLTDNEHDVTVGTVQVDIVGVLKAAKKAKPVTPKASPEATALLEYFYSISGKHILSGQHSYRF